MENRELAKEMLKGSIDLHIHSGPDVFPRKLNDIEVAEQAKAAGMRAVLLKSHLESTAGRAAIASLVTKFSVYGGLALNHSAGGLNPAAVRVAAQMGAKQIWMPTIHAEHYLKVVDNVPMFAKYLKPGTPGISVLGGDGKLKDEVLEIIDIIAEEDIILSTGHISVEEAMVLIEQAKKGGVKKILVTHPTSPMEGYTNECMKEAVARGASMMEHVVNDTTRQMKNPIPSTVISNAVRAVGAANTILSTDSGQVINPEPVISMENFICMMLDDGISQEDLKIMTVDNPKKMLGIEF